MKISIINKIVLFQLKDTNDDDVCLLVVQKNEINEDTSLITEMIENIYNVRYNEDFDDFDDFINNMIEDIGKKGYLCDRIFAEEIFA